MLRWLPLVAATAPLAGGCLQQLPEPGASSSAASTAAAGTGSTGDASTAPGTSGDPTQHPGCEHPLPDPLPELPYIRVDGAEVPTFAAWQGIDCDTALLDEVSTCAEGAGCPDSTCLLGSPTAGVCSEIDVDSSCAGGLEAMGWSDYQCWGCVAPLVHAKACCTFADQGFDCRDWPFPGNGPHGSICGRHQDCEPGLVCGPHIGSDYGICQCPGLDPETVAPGPGCY